MANIEVEKVSKQITYNLLVRQTEALLEKERDPVANMANLSALLYNTLSDINWAGFYRLIDGELLLGPFQGSPACVRIIMGKGVCGTAASKKEILVVRDVNQFPGHIACGAASNSEIVVPLIKNNQVLGVLDIDSPKYNRFNEEDRTGLENIVKVFLGKTQF